MMGAAANVRAQPLTPETFCWTCKRSRGSTSNKYTKTDAEPLACVLRLSEAHFSVPAQLPSPAFHSTASQSTHALFAEPPVTKHTQVSTFISRLLGRAP